MAIATLKPNDRYAVIGKTGSGKTQEAIVLASMFAQQLHSPWEVWWMDTKNEPSDIRQLRKWGACNGAVPKDIARPGGLRNFLYFKIDSDSGFSTIDLAQAKMAEAYDRKHVIVVVDEYTQVCPSVQNAGYALNNIMTRGRGRNVGLIGLTQEPVFIPRMLLTQASHVALFTVTGTRNLKYLKDMCPSYVPPLKQGDPHGFYWSHLDGSAEWAYYSNQRKWADSLQFALPKPPPVSEA